MGTGKGSNSTTQNSISRFIPDPAVQAAGQHALSAGITAAGAPFSQPPAPVAGFSPMQQQGFGLAQQVPGTAQPYFNQAQALMQQSAQPVSAQQVSNYFNPFASNVMANLAET